MSSRPLFLALIVLALAGAGVVPPLAWCAGEEGRPADQEGSTTLWFRRVYIPVDHLQSQLEKDNVSYVPMDREEFERLVAVGQRTRRTTRELLGAAVVAAEYSARLEGDTLVDGTGSLDVVHLAEGAAMLPLVPCGLAIGEASWTGQNRQAAAIGLGGGGNLGILVEETGRLDFDWSLRGRRELEGAISFRWEVPPSPINRLHLHLPKHMKPVMGHGVVTKGRLDDEGLQRWQIEFGGHHQLGIRIVPTEGVDEESPDAVVRQSTEYTFSPRGVKVTATLRLDVYTEPLRQITLALDPGLQPIKAEYVEALSGGLPVRWNVTSPPRGGRGSRVVLELPEPILGTDRVVRLEALAPLEVERVWRLPAIRPQGMFWQEGEATLSVLPPLRLGQLAAIHSRQLTAIGPLSPPSSEEPASTNRADRAAASPPAYSGETVQLQYFSPDATAEVLLNWEKGSIRLDCGTTVELSGDKTAALVIAHLSAAGGQRFHVEAEVAEGWIIDSVESESANVVADWVLAGKAEGSPRRLTIRLAKALPQSPPVRLKIVAQRPESPLGRNLGIDDLTPLCFATADGGRRLIWLRATGNYELKLSAEEGLRSVDPASLDPTVAGLFAETPRYPLFEHDAGAAGVQASLEARKPSYAGTIQVEATVSDDRLTESYRFHCVPGTVRVDRVLVQFSHGRAAPLRWTLGTQRENPLTARRLAPEGRGNLPGTSKGETWEITLQPPRSVPFQIHATRTTSLTDPQAVSLACLPEAADQRAMVVVYSSGRPAVRIENSGLKSIPSGTVPTDEPNAARATYRYDPSRDVGRAGGARLNISPLKAEDALPSAWVWSCRLQSRCEPSGTEQHLATYCLENAGTERLRFTLPSGVTPQDVHGVWVDGKRAAWRPAGEKTPRVLAVELTSANRFPVVSVHFTSTGPRLGLVGSIVPRWLQVDVPVMTRHWTAWLPPGYEACGPSLPGQRRTDGGVNWARRLFGPLGRKPDCPPFDPSAARDWYRLIRYQPDRKLAEQRAGTLLRGLGEKLARGGTGQAADNLDWGALLADASVVVPSSGPSGDRGRWEFLVDRLALARLGLTPRTPVSVPPGDDPSSRGVALLQQANLRLLVHQKAVVLTSDGNAATDHAQLAPVENEQLTPPENQMLRWIQAGPLSEQIGRAAAGESDGTFVPARDWQQRPADPKLPWARAQPAGFQPVDMRGWAAYEPQTVHESLAYAHRNTMQAFPWIAFLGVLGLAWWKALHRPATLTTLLGLFGAAALLLPQTCAPIASGALLGTLFVLGLTLICKRRERGSRAANTRGKPRPASPAGTATQVGILVFAGAALLVRCASAADQEPAGAASPAGPRTHLVYIPVDEQKQPTGNNYFVPEDFYVQLHRQADALAEKPQGWLLSAAAYQGVLSWQATSDRLMMTQLQATFDFHVLSPSAKVRIPFGGDSLEILPDGVLLNGQSIPWAFSQGALEFQAPEPGPCRLEVLLRPPKQTDDAASGFDLSIPRLALSRLELTLPPDAPDIEVPSALGSVRWERETDPSRLEAMLGPTERLSVRWQKGAGRGGGGPVVDAEELFWLKLEPRSSLPVVLDAQLKFKVLRGRVSEFLLAADPRLKLLLQVEGQPLPITAKVGPTRGQLQTVRLELPQPLSDQDGQEVIKATFQLKEASGVGNVRLPRLEVLDVPATKRWMAVSVDPSLEYGERASDELQQVAPSSFEAAWVGAKVQPLFAYDFTAGDVSWSISTRPRQPQTTVDQQTLALGFAATGVEVRFDARLVNAGGGRFQYRILAPEELEVESVSVVEGEEERVDRYSRDRDGAIIVFLDAEAGEGAEQKLSIRGRLPTTAPGKLPLPVLRLDGAEVQAASIQLFKKSDVRVEVSKTTGLVDAPPPAVDATKAALGRLVRCFAAEGSEPGAAMLTLRPNQPNIHARQITALRSEPEAWQAEVTFLMEVEGGVVDELLLGAPRSWSGPDQCSLSASDQPGLSASVVETESPDETRRRWVIRPSSPLEGQSRLTVSGPLESVPGDWIGAPDFTLAGAEVEEHVVVLPRERQLQPLEWETHGIAPTNLPDEFSPAPAARDSFVAYRVEDELFQAALRPFRGDPQIRLADIRLAWQADGTCHGVAIFDVDPGGLAECLLSLPSGYQLLQVKVADVATIAAPAGEGRWQVPLGADWFPQRMEVLFTGTVSGPDTSGLMHFESPTLSGLPADRTLWTISGPPSYRVGRLEGADSVSQLQQELVRLRSVEALMERAANVTPEGRDEAIAWYRAWASRWVASRDEIQRQLASPATADSARAAEAELQAGTQRASQLADRLGAGDVLAQVAGETPVVDRPGELWLHSPGGVRPTTRCLTRAGVSSITLTYRKAKIDGLSRRMVGAFGIVGLILVTVIGIRRGLLSACFSRWSHLLGVVAGLGWWLWLQPSVLGWGIVLLTLVAAFRSGWKRPRQASLTIVPSSLVDR